MDKCYRCYRCGGIVYEYQILFGAHRCRKCGSLKLEPIFQDLTKFGNWYCDKINRIGHWYYTRIRKGELSNG